MKNRRIIFFLLLVVPIFTSAQSQKIDSLKRVLNSATTDSARFKTDTRLARTYFEIHWETALKYADLLVTIASRNNHHYDEAKALDFKAYALLHLYRFSESFENFQKALQLAETDYPGERIWLGIRRLDILASIHHDMGQLMGLTHNVVQQIAE